MGEIINLRRVRKQKARDRAEAEAAANRAKFGRTKAEKAREAKETKRLSGHLAGAELEPENE